MKKICFSTGNFFTGKHGLNKEIELCTHLDIDGVEVLVGNCNDLSRLRISRKTLKFLRSLDYNTIHAPFYNGPRRAYFYNTPRSKRILDKLHELYDKIKARNINFHSTQIKNYKLFRQKACNNYNYSIENQTPKRHLKISDYARVLKQNPDFGFVLDISHSQLYSIQHIKKLIKKIGGRIRYTHLSANEFGEEHLPLSRISKKLLRQLSFLKKLNCNFVIETWLEKRNMDLFKKEIKFVRSWLR